MQIGSENRCHSPSPSATECSESQKAWYVAGLISSIGRPTKLPELISRCTALPAASPSTVAALCALPGSPIALIDEDLITLSNSGLAGLAFYLEGNPCSASDFAPSAIVERIRRDWRKAYQPIVDKMSRTNRINQSSGMANEAACHSRSPSATECSESEKAWYVAGLITSIGRPTKLPELISRCTELISRCTGLPAASPSAVAALCALPSSPIALMDEDLITLSNSGLAGLAFYLEGNPCPASEFMPSAMVERIRSDWRKAYQPIVDIMSRTIPINQLPGMTDEVACLSQNLVLCESTSCKTKKVDIEDEKDRLIDGKDETNMGMSGELAAGKVYVKLGCQTRIDLNLLPPEAEVMNQELDSQEAAQVSSAHCIEYSKQDCVASVRSQSVNADHEAITVRLLNNQAALEECRNEGGEFSYPERGTEGDSTSFYVSHQDMPPQKKLRINSAGCSNKTRSHIQKPIMVDSAPDSNSKSPGHAKTVHGPLVKQQHDQKSSSTMQKSNWNPEDKHIKERVGGQSTLVSSKDKEKSKPLPVFESYNVEEEEGSGGYGIVYRARRKDDGRLVAIKCPHAKAHKNHVENELKMLERFGGKNFVIKYEGCFKNEDSDCFVLEHVEHDRPEVLKKEINVFQLQWYSYCLFRGLASLHTEGIVHRDVKPGNFLFSRKTNTGYIIDFNLAMDLNRKHRSLDKGKAGLGKSSHVSLSSAISMHSSKSRKTPNATLVGGENLEGKKGSSTILQLKNLRKAAYQRKPSYDARGRSQINSQGGDGSGITSAKDVSSMTSAKRLREPLPCQGRKELISLVQESMLNPKNEVTHVPAPLRKRIIASQTVDKRFINLTPMPLQSRGVPISRTVMMKNKGPCAGTKGFRAPEVLLRSQYQGTKADIWSAGVTLLYLIIGKAPFGGDPEQNIKEIAMCRGSEALWEVAKLHDRDDSFPQELHETRYLMSTNLREWCRLNAKRREFLKTIPSSLFDLLEQCLTVNPRLRISAEDALRHDFFAPVHGILRKQRSVRQRNE